jgi:hypothetical protein
MQLKTLTYTSRASLDLSDADLADILAAAHRRNAMDAITGLLIFNGVRFLQIVEGPEQAIDALVLRLRADWRHTAFEVQDERQVAERSFADWSMELVQVDSDVMKAREQLDEVLPAGLTPAIRQLVIRNTEAIGGIVRLPG